MSALHRMTVGEIAAAKPLSAGLFETLGIDYACHGALTLREACAEAGLDPGDVRRSIDLLPKGKREAGWLDAPVTRLVDYLRGDQHPRVGQLILHAAAVLMERCGSCADHLDEIERIRRALADLGSAWSMHVKREEQYLLPLIAYLDECWAKGERATMRIEGGFGAALAASVQEHATLVEGVRRTESHALKLAARDLSCPRMQRAIREVGHAVREHVHLENNILYPRAAALHEAVERERMRTGSKP